MDALQLQALMRRLERPVSGLRENKACTFGEEGCRCALGGCLLHSVLVKSTLVEGTPEKTGECSFLGVDDSAVQASTLCGPLEAGMPEEGQISPSPTAPLQQQDVNALSVLHKKVEKKRCALPLKVSPRVEGTPIRQGTGFNTRKSPQPSRGNRAFGGSETPANDAESLMVTVAGSTLPTYRRENTYAGEPAPLDGDAHASHVTIISNPCSSSEVSLHNVPDLCNRLAEACTSVPQPKKQWQQDANPKGPCLADCPRECALVPPVSILNSSTAGTGRLSESRSPPPAAAINAVAPSVKGSARSAANGVSMVGGLSIIVGQGLMQTPASGCQGDANVGEELAASLLMPHDMTNVLFNGRPRRRVGAAGNVSVVEPTSDVGTPTRTRDDTRTEWELCPEVHAKHPNLATILASSRLDGSNIIEGQTPIVDRRTLLPSSDLSHTLGATSVCSKVHNPTAQQSPVSYSRSKASSGSVCSWSSGSLRPSSALAGHGTTSTTVTLQDTHQQATSPEAPQDMSSQMKAAVPRRCLLMQPQPTAPETALERELRQRQHTILDVPGVPYVDSPDISTHIDRTEARVKERKHQEFIIRWAQRGLIWQQQERAAQMRDEHFAKMRGVPEMPDPPSPRAMRETSPYRGAAPHKPQPQLKVPASSRPRPPPMHGLPPKNPQRRGL
ncbi:hypothetical protein ABL78_3761 [Leptomonas seymouri]|uniref:Uncharacterized protein n=1 Tax=Leptomonas seymouri TaxID=5684 RepID=A0A0N0P632_LEPSE|nr:hypothetical protein ABL78_3761 [Leptomonas seymouri]|eukprot:KPI87159.1 hypothetical protein ABL78_3761 [Leptomonas seymouri]